jgi:branched-chain amino acid transport system permease protein
MISVAPLRRVGVIGGALLGVVAVSELAGLRAPDYHSGWPIPWSVLLLALAPGCVTALTAIGLVLIYRATRIINFAHIGFASGTSVLFYELLVFKGVPYLLALGAALGAGLMGGAIVELLFIRRFAHAPRLVLTVVTLALAQFLIGIAGSIPKWLGDKRPTAGIPRTPLGRHTWKLPLGVLNGNHLLLFGFTIVVLAGFAAFFRFTSLGIAIRGAAENDDRASSMGVNTRLLSSFVWTVAAGLAAAAAVMQTSLNGRQLSGTSVAIAGVGSTLLLRALAAAVIGGMENLPVTVAAAFGLGIFENSISFAYNRSAIVDGVLLVVIVGVLLLKRKRLARALDSGTGAFAGTEEIRPIPEVLAQLPSVKAGVRRVQVLGAAVLLAYPWIMSPGQTSLGSLFAIYGIVVLSLVVLTGWGGQISLGQFGFVAVGGVVGGALTSNAHWPFLIALFVGASCGALAAVVVGLPALRIRGLFLALTTLAFAAAVSSLGLNPNYVGFLPTAVTRPRFLWIRMDDERAFFYFCVVCLLLAVAAATSMRRSRTGRVLIAMRENERSAQSFGVNLVRTRLATFALSGFLAAFAGVLFVTHQHRLAPQSFGPEASIQIFLMAVIGGLGSVPGALTGAIYLGLLNLFVKSDVWRQLSTGLLLLLLLLLFPGGLGAGVFKLRDAALRRVAIRRRLHVPSLMGDYGFAGATATKVALSPRFGIDGKEETRSRWRYQLPSRIGTAGASQQTKRWTY